MRMVLIASAILLILAGCTAEEGPAPEQPVPSADPAPAPSGPSGGNDPLADAKGERIGPQEMLSHNGPHSCYVRYIDQVYDITDYINLHPGGPDALLIFCGKSDDSFESTFLAKHGSSFLPKLMSEGKYVGYMD